MSEDHKEFEDRMAQVRRSAAKLGKTIEEWDAKFGDKAMKLKEFQKYIKMVKEEEEQDQLYEMANVTSRYHGINDVVIWVGIAPKQHGLRIKVSNIKNRFDPNDNFVVQMPSLYYDPLQVASWIDMKKILSWITLNQQILYDYEIGLIQDTGYFLDNLSKVNNESKD